jgi:serine/threonine protein kinase
VLGVESLSLGSLKVRFVSNCWQASVDDRHLIRQKRALLCGLRIACALCRSDLAFNYELGRLLGEGASAKVFQATHVTSGEIVAIKVFTDSKPETIHAACTEFVCAMRSAGPSALRYQELAFLKGRPALIMELGVQCLDAWIKVCNAHTHCLDNRECFKHCRTHCFIQNGTSP